MKTTTKEPRPKLTPVERSIRSREYAIVRLKKRRVDVMKWAAEDCAKIDRRIAEKQLVLDALKAGSIK